MRTRAARKLTHPHRRDGRLGHVLRALLKLLGGLAHAGLLLLGEPGVPAALLWRLDLLWRDGPDVVRPLRLGVERRGDGTQRAKTGRLGTYHCVGMDVEKGESW